MIQYLWYLVLSSYRKGFNMAFRFLIQGTVTAYDQQRKSLASSIFLRIADNVPETNEEILEILSRELSRETVDVKEEWIQFPEMAFLSQATQIEITSISITKL